MKKEKEVKAEIWEIKICGSALEMVHNAYQTIKEIYIPSEGISCNLADRYLHCFIDNGRYSRSKEDKLIKSITLPLIFVEKAKQYIKLQEALQINLKNYLGKE